MFENNSQLKGILNWAFSSGKPAEKILDLLVGIIMEEIGKKFAILDPLRAEKLITSDISSLLFDIATKKRNSISFSFFLNRIKRITLNLYQAGLLANKIYFSVIEATNTENSNFLDYFLSEHQQLPEFVTIRPKKGRSGCESGRKNEKRQGLKKKTLDRLQILNEISEFYPGCLEIEEEVRVQKSLFDFVKEKKIVKERVKVKKAA